MSEEIQRLFKDLEGLLSSSRSLASALTVSQMKPVHSLIICFLTSIILPRYRSIGLPSDLSLLAEKLQQHTL